MKTVLLDKILGGLLGMAIGDAMGGPIEGLSFSEIVARYGVVSDFLQYSNPPGVHVQWKNEPGTITDDTRLGMLLCDCAIRLGHMPTAKDLAERFLEHYYRTPKNSDAPGSRNTHSREYTANTRWFSVGNPRTGRS